MAQLGEAFPEAAAFGHGQRFEIVDELLGAGAPGIGLGVVACAFARAGQRLVAGLGEIIVHGARAGAGDEIARARHVEARDGRAGRHSFEDDKAERVGEAREDEAVGVGETRAEFLALFHAEEVRVLVLFLQCVEQRSVADDNFGAGQVGLEEGRDVFLDGDAADIEPDRLLHAFEGAAIILPLRRVEEVGVNAARPGDDVLEALGRKLVAHRGGRDHDAAGVFVKLAHVHVAHPVGQEEEARRNVFGKARVVRGCVGKLVAQADRARGPAERAFGGDVNRVGFEFEEALLDDFLRAEGQLDLGISRQRDRLEAVGRDDVPRMAHLLALGDDALHRADNAIHLRIPGVGYQHDAHCGRLFLL